MIYELKQKIRHSKWGEKFSDWLEKTPIFPVCYRILWGVGLAEIDPLSRPPKESSAYFNSNQDSINRIASLLADKQSKEIFLNNIKGRMSGFWRMKNSAPDQYFPKDILFLSDNEVFVDCGAYTGDTIAKFREHSHDHYKKIVAFEPDTGCRQKILDQKIAKCEVLPFGAWNKKETQVFYENGTGGSVVSSVVKDTQRSLSSSMKQTTISLEKIDDLEQCADMTFLKMDIEGAELNALKGAEQTIRRQRPKLAICIYHSNQDMLEIPLWVASLDLGYKLYIRHYSAGMGETVLYAV